jgi:4-hydroxybenzoate polyprenyltransferase
MAKKTEAKTTDIDTEGFLTLLPKAWQPYGQLMRLDRPIGWWLLLLPAWWAILIAGLVNGVPFADSVILMIVFLLGAIVMRGAGCVINDLWDRDLDNAVARTRSRALAAGVISPLRAILFLAVLSAVGLAILLTLPMIAVWTGLAVLPLIVIYPLAKRLIGLPQIVLAIPYSWGAWLGWCAHDVIPTPITLILFLAAAFWVFGYDTIYAIQDMADDRHVGIKSSALTLGRWLIPVVAFCYMAFLAGLLIAGAMRDAGLVYYAGLGALALHLRFQIRRINLDDTEGAGEIFRSNRDAGLIITLALLAEYLI